MFEVRKSRRIREFVHTIIETYQRAVRVAAGLRIGINIRQPHSRPCGDLIDGNEAHAITDIVYCMAHIPCIKEPLGLMGSDGKKSDGLILSP